MASSGLHLGPVEGHAEEGGIRLCHADGPRGEDEVQVLLEAELTDDRAQVRAPVADDPDRHAVERPHLGQHRLDVGIQLPGIGRELAGKDVVEQLRVGLDPDPFEQNAVVAPPVVLDPAVVGPGVVVGPVILVPEPSVRVIPCRAEVVLGDRTAVGREHAAQRVDQRRSRREEREARVEAEESVAHGQQR